MQIPVAWAYYENLAYLLFLWTLRTLKCEKSPLHTTPKCLYFGYSGNDLCRASEPVAFACANEFTQNDLLPWSS